jgi:hypothetical protein
VEITYQYRDLLRDEIFTEASDALASRFLSRKPRHYCDAAIRFPIASYLAFRPEHKWGSLHPALPFMDHQYLLNIEASGKRMAAR